MFIIFNCEVLFGKIFKYIYRMNDNLDFVVDNVFVIDLEVGIMKIEKVLKIIVLFFKV